MTGHSGLFRTRSEERLAWRAVARLTDPLYEAEYRQCLEVLRGLTGLAYGLSMAERRPREARLAFCRAMNEIAIGSFWLSGDYEDRCNGN